MAVSKANLNAVARHNFTGFHAHKDFLNRDFNAISTDLLTEHDVDKIQVSLKNMRQHIENIENHLIENSQVPGEVDHGK